MCVWASSSKSIKLKHSELLYTMIVRMRGEMQVYEGGGLSCVFPTPPDCWPACSWGRSSRAGGEGAGAEWKLSCPEGLSVVFSLQCTNLEVISVLQMGNLKVRVLWNTLRSKRYGVVSGWAGIWTQVCLTSKSMLFTWFHPLSRYLWRKWGQGNY